AAPGLSGQEQTEQIGFARSLSISAAALALATTATVTENVPEAFWTVFAVCVVQMIVFMLYIIVRWWAEDPFDRNYVQIALNTLSLLIEICRCLYSYSQALRPSEGSPKDLVTAHHYLFSAVAMIVLWTWCIGFWVKYFYKIAVRIP